MSLLLLLPGPWIPQVAVTPIQPVFPGRIEDIDVQPIIKRFVTVRQVAGHHQPFMLAPGRTRPHVDNP